MNRSRVFKKFLVPSVLVGAAVISEAGSDSDSGEVKKVRPSELPIYDVNTKCKPRSGVASDPSVLESQISAVRKELWVWQDKYKGLRKEVVDVYQTGVAHTESSLEYLKEESNYLPRYGAIAIGGVAGAVLGLRGGAIKKLAYSTTGALAVAALCYPTQATLVGHEVAREAKRGANIAYNFVYGVKPDYLKLPDPATFLGDAGADVKKPASSDVAKPSMLDSIKTSFMEMTGMGESKQAKPAASETSSRDQSHPDDKNLYTTRK